MQHFKQYATTSNDDGTINVHDLEIFKLGKHKGFDYSADWAQKAIAKHQQLATADNYYPSVIIGHNDGLQEKPSKGLLDNFQLDGEVIKADIKNIHPETFESLKKREYPHRSVEVNPDDYRFTALALLGGTPPYHKLPVMEFGADEDSEVIEFEEIDLVASVELDDKLEKFRKIFWKMMDMINNLIHENNEGETDKTKQIKSVLQQGAGMINEEVNNFQEGKGMPDKITLTDEHSKLYAQQFAEKNGMTPEEAFAEVQRMKDEQQKTAAANREQRIAAFSENLKTKYGVSPKVADEMVKPFLQSVPADSAVKFSEKTGLEAVENMFTAIFEAAQGKTLLADTSERAHGEEFQNPGESQNLNFSDADAEARTALHNKALKMVETGEAKDYMEAIGKVSATFNGNIQ